MAMQHTPTTQIQWRVAIGGRGPVLETVQPTPVAPRGLPDQRCIYSYIYIYIYMHMHTYVRGSSVRREAARTARQYVKWI